MATIFEQVLILFVFLIIGFVLAKSGVVKSEHSAIISKLLVYVFLPASIIKTFARNCTPSYIGANYPLILISLAIILILAVGGRLASKLFSKDKHERAIYEYSMVVPNFGYMGYAFVEALFAEAGLMNAMMFSMPMSIYTYTVGFCILSRKSLSPKSLLNPTMIALAVGMILGLSGVGEIMPSVAYTVLEKAGACMAPLSMLLVGIVISDFKLPVMLKNPRVYIITALRLFVIPAAIGGALTLLSASAAAIRSALLLYAMPCGLNTVVFVKNAGGNCEIGAGLALVSNILACASVPLVLFMFGITV